MPERCLRINGPVLIGGWFIIVIIVLGAVVVGMDCLFPISGLTFAAYDFVLTFEKLALQFCVRVLAVHCPLPFFMLYRDWLALYGVGKEFVAVLIYVILDGC